MSIKILFYLYFLFFSVVSLSSYKKGIYLLWLSVLFIPWMILVHRIFIGFQLIELMIIVSLSSELLYRKDRSFSIFFSNHTTAIFVYLAFSMCVLLFSEVVPLSMQFRYLRQEILFLLCGIQIFLLLKKDALSSVILFRIVCAAIVFNLIYCIIFEMILRFNPAGTPLYVLLGMGDNRFIADMIDRGRGIMGFRLQSIYAHPLSLAQYLLLMLPLFFIKDKQKFRLFFIFAIFFIIILTGSRSSIIPAVLITSFILIISTKKAFIKNSLYFLVAFILLIELFPSKMIEKHVNMVENYAYFWDDKNQKENDIRGSSVEMRNNQMKAALKTIEDSPAFGLGYGYRDYYIGKHNSLHPVLLGFESVFLLQLVERGWLGLIAYFLVIFFIYKQLSINVTDKKVIVMLFIGFVLSIIMTGVRPASLLILILTGSLARSMSPKKSFLPTKSIIQKYCRRLL